MRRRHWLAVLCALPGLIVAVPSAAAQDDPTHPCDDNDSPVPWEGKTADAFLRIRVRVTGDDIVGDWCLFQGEDRGLMRYTGHFKAGQDYVYDYWYPADLFTARFYSLPGVVRTSGGANVSLSDCPGQRGEILLHVHWRAPSTIGMDPRGRCLDAAEAAADETPGAPRQGSLRTLASTPRFEGTSADNWASAAWATGLGTLLAVPLLAGPKIKAFVAAAFTRVASAQALDHHVRREIVEAVRADPGVHGSEIARRLGLSRGVFLLHSRVLVRLGLLDIVRDGGLRRFFEGHRFTPAQRRQIAALRPALPRAVYEAIGSASGTVGSVASHLGVSSSAVSKALSRLSSAGLVAREGRIVRAVGPKPLWAASD